MQSHQSAFGSDSQKARTHRRNDTIGKAMPITSLLMNHMPARNQYSEGIRSDAGGNGDLSPTQLERPPLYFPISESNSPEPSAAQTKQSTENSTTQQEDDEIEEIDLEQEYELLVSECSSNDDYNDERRRSHSDEFISLVGKSKFYTPCLTCVGSAPTELACRPTAINAMCEKLCSEECRLRLSLAGFEPKSMISQRQLGNQKMLEEYFKSKLDANSQTPPELPPRISKKTTNEHNVTQLTCQPPALPPRLKKNSKELPELPKSPAPTLNATSVHPGSIAIQRKKFLTDLLSQHLSYDDSSSDDTDEETNKKSSPKELLDIMTSIIIPTTAVCIEKPPNKPTTTTTAALQQQNQAPQQQQQQQLPQVDPHELAMLKDFREKFEIAEALAKTSAMTSTTQIKQRLAVRKLEMDKANKLFDNIAIDGDNGIAAVAADVVAHNAENDDAKKSHAISNEPQRSNKTGLFTDDHQLGVSHNAVTITSNNNNNTKITAATHKLPDTVSTTAQYYADNEPPRDLLLYLVRMGSFNSAPKINNVDSQDDGLEIPKGLSTHELLQHVQHLRGEQQPPLLSRYFLKPLNTQSISTDVTDGLRYLKLNSVSRVCGAPISDPNCIRLLQWNLLSQTLGQNNDGFVRCPEEALTWDNRKFLIIQEILQNSPDIICLQEVDHFKFLQNILGTQNYEGVFFPKPDSPCLYIEENNGPDGCAIFYKRDKFQMKNSDTRILEVWRVQSNQVAIAANLQIKATGRELCVCTTHLKARHGSLLSKLRNEQGRDLMRFVKQFAAERPVIMCGDFNAEPIEPVYATVLNCEFFKLASAYSDIRSQSDECNNESELEKSVRSNGDATGSNGSCQTQSSSTNDINCDKVQKSIENEPPYTTWKIREHGEECHTIDYVFYTKDLLKVKNCLEFPHADEIGAQRTPSFQYPSDHFSLVCDFELLDKQQQQLSGSGDTASNAEKPKLQ